MIRLSKGRWRHLPWPWLGDNQVVTTVSKGKDRNYHLSDTAGIKLNDKAAKASELRTGDETIIVFDKQGERYTILELCIKRK